MIQACKMPSAVLLSWAIECLFLSATQQRAQASENDALQLARLQSVELDHTSSTCPPLNRSTLKSSLVAGQKLRLLFFSTWCSDCAKHLRELGVQEPAEPVIVVALFDTQKKVEATLKRMQLKIPCFMDDGLAKSLGVKTVPAERSLELSDL